MKSIKNVLKALFLGFLGGSIYVFIEIICRGYSHWSSFVMGCLAFLIIGDFNEDVEWAEPIWLQMIKGSIITTIIELITGLIVNIWLGENAWDYSSQAFNLWGQICPLFSFFWCWTSLICILLDDYIRYRFFGEEKPHYRWIF